MSKLQEYLYKFMNEYASVYEMEITNKIKTQFGKFIRNDIADEFKNIPIVILDKYQIKAGHGAGLWTKVPWIAIFDKIITTSAQSGVYITYLLNKDTKE